MNQHVLDPGLPADDIRAVAKRIHRHCMGFRGADIRRSTIQLLNTLIPLAILVVAMSSKTERLASRSRNFATDVSSFR